MDNLSDREREAKHIAVKLMLCDFGREVAMKTLEMDGSKMGWLPKLIEEYGHKVMKAIDQVEIEWTEMHFEAKRANAD